MFTKLLTSKKFLLGLGGLALLTLALSFFLPQANKPTLISSTPHTNSTKYSLIDPLEFKFRNSVLATDFSLSSTPVSEWVITQKDVQTLSATHPKPLSPSTQYTVNILWKGQFLASLTFTTIASQTDYELLDRLETELARDYPLANFVPYTTVQYRVIYTAPLTLEITLKNPNISSDEAVADIQSWVKSQGVDPASHKYVVAE